MHAVALHPNVATLLGACADPGAVDARGGPLGVGLVLEVRNSRLLLLLGVVSARARNLS